MLAFSINAKAEIQNFINKNPEEIKGHLSPYFDEKKEAITFNNDLLKVEMFFQYVPFEERIELMKMVADNKLIGKIKIKDKISYSGIYGDIEANNIEDFINQKEKNKKYLYSSLKKIDNYAVSFSKNAKKYEKILSDKYVKEIAEKVVGKKGDIIIFESEKEPYLFCKNDKNKISILNLNDLL